MISSQERNILRDCAKRVADIAELPIQEQRRDLWKGHHRLKPQRPMILVFPEGSWIELMPSKDLACEDRTARRIERMLRQRIYCHAHFQDDTVIEKEWIVQKVIHNTGWGLQGKTKPSTIPRGAWKFDPVLKEPSDLKKLRFPDISYDEAMTMAALEKAQDLFGNILDVKLTGVSHLSYHLMSQYIFWRGLEEMMLDMYDHPGLLHDTMAFLEEGHHRILQQYIDRNLLSLNNDGTYHNSGGVGYTDELPSSGFSPDRIRPCDMWASAESQELAQVSPAHHVEFALQYENRLLAPFGLTGYGCCEDLTGKLDDVFTLPNIRRISISPFADVASCAEKLKGDYIFSWKPHPAHLVGDFNEDRVRMYIRHTVDVAREYGCVLEMILKDTHTCQHHPERFDRWTKIAREEVERAVG